MKKYIIFVLALIVTYLSCSYVPEFNGIDISHHNKVNWDEIKKDSNIKFCYIKATEGKSFRDPMCKQHTIKAKQNNLYVGLYHYFRTNVSSEAQFNNFKKIASSVDFDLIPVIDVEQDGNDFSNTTKVNTILSELVDLFEQEYKCKPIIYLGSFCCVKVLPTVYDCPIWLRFIKSYNFVPNTTIKQCSIINDLDRNYCRNIKNIML